MQRGFTWTQEPRSGNRICHVARHEHLIYYGTVLISDHDAFPGFWWSFAVRGRRHLNKTGQAPTESEGKAIVERLIAELAASVWTTQPVEEPEPE